MVETIVHTLKVTVNSYSTTNTPPNIFRQRTSEEKMIDRFSAATKKAFRITSSTSVKKDVLG